MNKKDKTQVDIGLDIGIASVGWAITNVETLDIIEYGARLFPTVDDPKDSKLKNEERREARSARRQVNRRRTLKRDFVKFLIDSEHIKNLQVDKKGVFVQEFLDKYINNKDLQKKWNQENKELPYILTFRKQGLNSKLDKNKLIAILYWYINHRGFKYEISGEKVETEILKNKDFSPVENQIKYFKTKGYLNGTFNRSIHSNEYIKEIKAIFKNQGLSSKFEQGFIELFKRQRSFEEGPGDEKAKTRYGRFYDLKKIVDGKTIKYELVKKEKPAESIWEDTIGRCTFYPEEFRAPKKTFTSEVFNLLSQLNDITIKSTGELLNKENKLEILKLAISGATSNNMFKTIKEMFKIDKHVEGEIHGVSDDKLTEINTVRNLKKILPENLIEFDQLIKNDKIVKNNILDQMFSIFAQTKIIEERFKRLSNIDQLSKNVKLIKEISEKDIENVSKTHSLSFKAMQDMIFNLININKYNQMLFAKEKGIDFHKNKDYGSTYLKTEWIEDIIITPSVKRAFRQTTKVLNAIFKLAYDRKLEIRSIIIETAREAKNKEARVNETNRQKYFAEKNKQLVELVRGKTNKDISNFLNRTLEKIWLLDQQKGCDAYTGEKIEFEDVIKKPGDYDIDHIIPRSQSFSNHKSNVVLTKQQINQSKGNQTPYQFLGNDKTKWNKLEGMWKSWYKNNPNERRVFNDYEKYDYLISQIDFSKPENRLGFISRNLVDTRYTTKMILGALTIFKDNPNNNFNYKVKAINGKMTSFARGRISEKYIKGKLVEQLKRPNGLSLFEYEEIEENGVTRKITKKSRIWHGHHSEDAYILTILNSHFNDSKAIELILNSPNRKFLELKANKEDADPNWAENKYEKLLSLFDKGRQKLNEKMEEIRFSRMIERPKNTKLFNETLYKGKINKEGQLDKYSYKYILDKNFKANDYFGEDAKYKEKLIIYKKDKLLYDALNSIYLNYLGENKNNPFIAIAEENARYLEVIYKDGKKQITKKIYRLNYLDQEGKNPLKVIKANNNNRSFYETLNWLFINMYKNQDGKYKLIPINASNHEFKVKENGKVLWIPRTSVLEKQFKEKKIASNEKPCATFFKGDLIELQNNGEMVYVTGSNENISLLEFNFLSRQNKKRDFRTINKGLLGSNLCKTDILGISKKIKFQF